MTIANASDILYEDLLNRKSYHNDSNLGPGKKKKIYIHITNPNGVKKVFLHLYGEKANQALLTHFHNVGTYQSDAIANCAGSAGGVACGHNHTISGSNSNNTPSITNASSVPKNLQIWIDGVNYTTTIGDPNGKGVTMWTGSNWGIDGSTEWSTGELDLSSIISWTEGEHYIEFIEAGNIGGRLLYNLYVNTES